MEPPYTHSMSGYGSTSISPTTPYGPSSTTTAFHQSTPFATNGNDNGYYANQNQAYVTPQGMYQQQQSHVSMQSPSNGGPGYPMHSTHQQMPQQYPPQSTGLPFSNGSVPQYAKSASIGNNSWDSGRNSVAPPFTRGMSATSNASSSTPAPTASELVSPASEPSVRTPASTESFPTSGGTHISAYSATHMGGSLNYQQPSYGHHQPQFALPPTSVPSSPAVPMGGGMGPHIATSQPPPLQEQFTGKKIETKEDWQEYKQMFDVAQSQTSRRGSIPNGRPGVPVPAGGASGLQSRRSSVASVTLPTGNAGASPIASHPTPRQSSGTPISYSHYTQQSPYSHNNHSNVSSPVVVHPHSQYPSSEHGSHQHPPNQQSSTPQQYQQYRVSQPHPSIYPDTSYPNMTTPTSSIPPPSPFAPGPMQSSTPNNSYWAPHSSAAQRSTPGHPTPQPLNPLLPTSSFGTIPNTSAASTTVPNTPTSATSTSFPLHQLQQVHLGSFNSAPTQQTSSPSLAGAGSNQQGPHLPNSIRTRKPERPRLLIEQGYSPHGTAIPLPSAGDETGSREGGDSSVTTAVSSNEQNGEAEAGKSTEAGSGNEHTSQVPNPASAASPVNPDVSAASAMLEVPATSAGSGATGGLVFSSLHGMHVPLPALNNENSASPQVVRSMSNSAGPNETNGTTTDHASPIVHVAQNAPVLPFAPSSSPIASNMAAILRTASSDDLQPTKFLENRHNQHQQQVQYRQQLAQHHDSQRKQQGLSQVQQQGSMALNRDHLPGGPVHAQQMAIRQHQVLPLGQGSVPSTPTHMQGPPFNSPMQPQNSGPFTPNRPMSSQQQYQQSYQQYMAPQPNPYPPPGSQYGPQNPSWQPVPSGPRELPGQSTFNVQPQQQYQPSMAGVPSSAPQHNYPSMVGAVQPAPGYQPQYPQQQAQGPWNQQQAQGLWQGGQPPSRQQYPQQGSYGLPSDLPHIPYGHHVNPPPGMVYTNHPAPSPQYPPQYQQQSSLIQPSGLPGAYVPSSAPSTDSDTPQSSSSAHASVPTSATSSSTPVNTTWVPREPGPPVRDRTPLFVRAATPEPTPPPGYPPGRKVDRYHPMHEEATKGGLLRYNGYEIHEAYAISSNPISNPYGFRHDRGTLPIAAEHAQQAAAAIRAAATPAKSKKRKAPSSNSRRSGRRTTNAKKPQMLEDTDDEAPDQSGSTHEPSTPKAPRPRRKAAAKIFAAGLAEPEEDDEEEYFSEEEIKSKSDSDDDYTEDAPSRPSKSRRRKTGYTEDEGAEAESTSSLRDESTSATASSPVKSKSSGRLSAKANTNISASVSSSTRSGRR